MSHIDSHPPDSFCWLELATTDQAAAKSFYSSLFGWTSSDSPLGPGEVYTIFKLDGRDAAAGYTMFAEQRSQGVPPNWMLYISVNSADDAAKRAKTAGGTVLKDALTSASRAEWPCYKIPLARYLRSGNPTNTRASESHMWMELFAGPT